MPKRKAVTRISGLLGSDDEDLMQGSATVAQEPQSDERPAKRSRGRGRPRSKSTEIRQSLQSNADSTTAPRVSDAGAKKSTRRGRPKGSRNSGQIATHEAEENQEQYEAGPVPDGEIEETQADLQPKKAAKSTKGAGARGRRKAIAEKQVKTDGEFEYTPKSTRHRKSPATHQEEAEPSSGRQRKSLPVPDDDELEVENADVIEETMIYEEVAQPRSISMSPFKRRQSSQRALQSSPLKRKSGGVAEDDKAGGEVELRRRLGDLTKKYDTLENRYRNLKEIGIVEANANVEKLRKHCESMTTASNNLVASLKAELETQKALGQKSRLLQKQLRERDHELAQLKSQAEEADVQLTAAQTEVKALQTKLTAARNTAATLENASVKVPGSAIKGSAANRAQAAANAEAVHAAQFAQLKEDLYSDLTGLIIRDIKKRDENSSLYDCIQTGGNGTLHFKLAVPNVSSSNFEKAEFQYIPLLDDNRDRELIDILPEYLTVEISFVRIQASKFYARIIDALTRRRTSSAN